MAEGWAKHLKGDELEVYSAGIEKHGLNPYAVKVMAEVGIDITIQQSNLMSELPLEEFDWVITLCGHANETCPYFPGKRIHIGFDDPPKLAAEASSEEEKLIPYKKVRDEIRDFIGTLPESLLSHYKG